MSKQILKTVSKQLCCFWLRILPKIYVKFSQVLPKCFRQNAVRRRRLRRSSLSFVTDLNNRSSRKSRERFHLESPNFTGPPSRTVLDSHWIWRHYQLPIGSFHEKKKTLRRFQVELVDNSLSQDHEILHTYLEQSATQRCRILRHWLLPVGCKMQLNTAHKCVKRVRPDKKSNNSAIV